MADNKLFVLSGVSAFIIYTSLILIFFISSSYKPVEIGSSKNDTFAIDVIVQENESLPIEETLNIEHTVSASNIFENVEQNSKENVSKLFKLTPDDFGTKQKIMKSDKSAAEVNKFTFYQEQREDTPKVELSLQQIQQLQKSATLLSSNKSDPYYSQIYDKLAESWKPMGFKDYLTAKVIISIYSNGKFDYVILRKSTNYVFDNDLILFLERQKLILFPPYKSGRSTSIEVNFTSKGI